MDKQNKSEVELGKVEALCQAISNLANHAYTLKEFSSVATPPLADCRSYLEAVESDPDSLEDFESIQVFQEYLQGFCVAWRNSWRASESLATSPTIVTALREPSGTNLVFRTQQDIQKIGAWISECFPSNESGKIGHVEMSKLIFLLHENCPFPEWDRLFDQLNERTIELRTLFSRTSAVILSEGRDGQEENIEDILKVDVKSCKVEYRGKTYEVSSEGIALLDGLAKAYPDEIAATQFCTKPSRVKDTLHKALQILIKSKPGKGTWLELPE